MDGAVLQVLRETLSSDQAVRQHAEQQLNHLLIVPGESLSTAVRSFWSHEGID